MSILNLSYNQCMSHLSCCTDSGYIIYSLKPQIEKFATKHKGGGVGLMKMYNKSNISLLVGGGIHPFRSKDTVILWDDNKEKNVIEIDLRENIKNAFLTKSRIVVILDKKVRIFDYNGGLMDEKITYYNDNGIGMISTDESKSVVVALLGTKKGGVAIWKPDVNDYIDLDAHSNNIEALAISHDGSFVATASEVGTLIRIYNTDRGKMEYEFRRGTSTAKIYSLCFSYDLSILACYSSNGTIHFFDLSKNKIENKNTLSMFAGFKDYLPSYFNSQWSFKQINLGQNVNGIIGFDDENNLHVCTYDGNYHKISGRDNKFYNVSQGNLNINNK